MSKNLADSAEKLADSAEKLADLAEKLADLAKWPSQKVTKFVCEMTVTKSHKMDFVTAICFMNFVTAIFAT